MHIVVKNEKMLIPVVADGVPAAVVAVHGQHAQARLVVEPAINSINIYIQYFINGTIIED